MQNRRILKPGDYKDYLDRPDIIIQADFTGWLKRRNQRHLKSERDFTPGRFSVAEMEGS